MLVLILKLLSGNVGKTMTGLTKTLMVEKHKTEKDKDINGVSAERINNRGPQNPGGRKYERRLFRKPVLVTGSIGCEIMHVCLIRTEKLTGTRIGIRMCGGVQPRDRHR